MSPHRINVAPLPVWLDVERLLGHEGAAWVCEPCGADCIEARAAVDRGCAAVVAERLRGLGFGGWPVSVQVDPPLDRSTVRNARLQEARARRQGASGFLRKGARMDEEGRYSLTAEGLALAVGRMAGEVRVVDAGCGVGGNTIGFARAGCSVVAIDNCDKRLTMARHNAGLYGVEGAVRFELGDAVEAMARLSTDLLFVDPPWGGEEFDRRMFNLAGLELLEAALAHRARHGAVWAKVPASSDTRTLLTIPGAAPPLPIFGEGPGDRQRVKFLLLRFG